MYCGISKVASTTWTTNLLKLRGYELKKYRETLMKKHGLVQSQIRPEIRKRHFALQEDSVNEANEKLVSFAFVRDPFDRLESCYYNKMVIKDQSLKWMRDHILVTYRKVENPGNLTPSPQEFAQYLIDLSLTTPYENWDDHIKPLWASCPFCSVNFDIIGQMETYDEDAKFIIENLQLDLEIGEHKNHGGKKRDFYEQIPLDMVEKLYEIYKEDFEMFGYEKPTFS